MVLVSIDFGEPDYAESLAELKLLAGGAGLAIRAVVEAKRDRPDAALFVGSGKADEIAASAQAADAALVIFNHDLSPVQERNLEKRMQCRVLDRTALILDIFAQRARSNEGKLQVELAQLRHYATRLVRGWSHLERQKGGIGMRGGPGETQLELDRRIINAKIKNIEARLAKLGKSRALQGRARRRGGALSVSLVGYTNAGKSTLLNQLTGSTVLAEDALFATLDTRSRRLYLPSGREAVITDTVGFIRELPKDLFDAFRATFEEAEDADLLLHCVDASDPCYVDQLQTSEELLLELKLEHIQRLIVFTKADRLEESRADALAAAHDGVALNALDAACRAPLIARIDAMLPR